MRCPFRWGAAGSAPFRASAPMPSCTRRRIRRLNAFARRWLQAGALSPALARSCLALPCLCSLLFALCLLPFAWASDLESSRKASRAPEPGAAEEQPMSERSEFGLRNREGPNVPRQARSTGDRCGFIASARVRRRDLLVPFGSLQKGLARAAGESRALALFVYSTWPRLVAKNRASALFARLTFVLSKVSTTARTRWRTAKPARRASAEGASQTAIAGHEPTRLRRAGPLRSSPDAARSPNSLRSNMGCSSATSGSGARLALRLDSDQKLDAKAKAKAKAKSKAKKQSQEQTQKPQAPATPELQAPNRDIEQAKKPTKKAARRPPSDASRERATQYFDTPPSTLSLQASMPPATL